MSEDLLLTDVWRVMHPEEKIYIYFRKKTIYKARHLDYAMVSNGVLDLIEQSMYLPGILTDHSGFYMTLRLSQNPRGKGYWKLNNSHLKELDFITCINDCIDEAIVQASNMDPIKKWECIKQRIRRKAKYFARQKALDKDLIISQLSEFLVDMQQVDFDANPDKIEIYASTKADLDDIMMEKAKSLIFRTRCSWYEYEGKSSKYFYALEKAKYQAKTCHALFDEKNEIVTDNDLILQMQRKYYKSLYSKDNEVNFDMINETEIHVLTNMRHEHDQPFELREVAIAVKQLANNKCPGLDGISIDLYKVFWKKLGDPLYQMIKAVFESRKLSVSARTGLMNLILKVQKDMRFLKNRHPIKLLNADYKVIEKMLANRIVPALDYIIDIDQKGFMSDRRISINIRKIFDILAYAEQEKLDAIILSLDFEKSTLRPFLV